MILSNTLRATTIIVLVALIGGFVLFYSKNNAVRWIVSIFAALAILFTMIYYAKKTTPQTT